MIIIKFCLNTLSFLFNIVIYNISGNMSSLVSLLNCCNVSTNTSSLKSLLRSIVDLFDSSSEEFVIIELCTALRTWKDLGGNTKGIVERCVATLLETLWDKSETNLKLLKTSTASLTAGSEGSGRFTNYCYNQI